VICRGRKYADVSPLPLAIQDINAYLEVYPLLIDRMEFDAAIYALDQIVLDEIRSK